jgi:type I restriction enzyme S subunit
MINPEIIFTKGYNPKTVFLRYYKELDGRLDPSFYEPLNLSLIEEIKKMPHRKLYEIANFSSESWNQKDLFENEFPYIEISEIDIPTGDILNVSIIPKSEAPSRAKKIVRDGDILVSTTRPSRGAICLIDEKYDLHIASTGFEIIRAIDEKYLDKEYLFNILRTRFCLMQMFYRSSGGNYPAITQEQLGKILIPLPSKSIQQKVNSIFSKARTTHSNNKAKEKEIIKSIDTYILKILEITLPEEDNSIEKRIFTKDFKIVNDIGRLDPKRYSLFVSNLEKSICNDNFPKQKLSDLLLHKASGDWGLDEELIKDFNLFEKCLVIRATEFDNDYNLNIDNSRLKYRHILKSKLKKLDIQPQDILIEKSGGSENQPVGRVAIIEKDLIDKQTLCFSNFIYKIRVDKKIVLPHYLFYYLKTMHNIKYTDVMQSQTNGIRNLIMKEFFAQEIPLPSLDKQREIVLTVTNLYKNAKKNSAEVEILNNNSQTEIEEILLN